MARRLPAVTRILVLVVLLVSAVPAAAQDRIALGGPMQFSTEDVAFVGWFVGAQADVWRVEPVIRRSAAQTIFGIAAFAECIGAGSSDCPSTMKWPAWPTIARSFPYSTPNPEPDCAGLPEHVAVPHQ